MAYKLVKDIKYPEADKYRGPAEVLTAELKGPPEQVMPTWIVDQIIIWFYNTIGAHKGKVMTAKVWADISPTWQTKYKIELATHASPLAWTLIIRAVAALGIVIGLAFITWQVTHTTWGPMIPIALIVVGLAILASTFWGKGKKK